MEGGAKRDRVVAVTAFFPPLLQVKREEQKQSIALRRAAGIRVPAYFANVNLAKTK